MAVILSRPQCVKLVRLVFNCLTISKWCIFYYVPTHWSTRLTGVHDDVMTWTRLPHLCSLWIPRRQWTRFYATFVVSLNKLFSKQWDSWWCETPSDSCDIAVMMVDGNFIDESLSGSSWQALCFVNSYCQEWWQFTIWIYSAWIQD